MGRSSLRVTNGAFPNIKGLAKLQRKIAAIPDEVTSRVKPALELDADEFVEKVIEFAPVNDLEPHPGALKAGVHKEAGPHELSVVVAVDAVDSKGRPYPKHVETGHLAADGSHVPAEPFFWPAYNTLKRRMRTRLARAMSAGVKAAAALGGNSPE